MQAAYLRTLGSQRSVNQVQIVMFRKFSSSVSRKKNPALLRAHSGFGHQRSNRDVRSQVATGSQSCQWFYGLGFLESRIRATGTLHFRLPKLGLGRFNSSSTAPTS